MLAEPRTISVRRSRFLHENLYERVELFNYNPYALSLTIRFTFGADFRDMFDVRGFEVEDTEGRGEVEPIVVEPDGVLLGYRSRVARRRTQIVFEPRPDNVEIVHATMTRVVRKEGPHLDQRDEGLVVPPVAAAVFHIELPPMRGRSIAIRARPEADYAPTLAARTDGFTKAESWGAEDATIAELQNSYARWRDAATHIETDHEFFNLTLHRALLDLHLLVEEFDGDLVPTAGIPWFAVPFGRDSLITAMQTLSVRPDIASGTLRFLARHQGTRVNKLRGEEPGKILHEMRPGERGGVPESIYYGSTDATPLFVVALGEYVAWSGDLELARELLPNAEAAVTWMDEFGDIDGDGFIEMDRYPPDGLGSQGWKDSPDAITHRSGQPAPAPIALAEVHAYKFAAHWHIADLYARLGDTTKEKMQRRAAERARALFEERLAVGDEAGEYWAMGLDAHKERIETTTSNPGHALWTGLLRGRDARLTARRLLADDMLTGWGIRTLSSHAPSYNPMSYHNGAVWPHDTALIALGMKRAGDDNAACEVASQILEAGLLFPGGRLPELWCGFARDRRHRSTPAQYPVGCSPQAWAAGSAFMLLQALLGLEANARDGDLGGGGTLRLRPSLPPWLHRIRYTNMRVAGRQVAFEIKREDDRLAVDVIDSAGLRIETSQVLERG